MRLVVTVSNVGGKGGKSVFGEDGEDGQDDQAGEDDGRIAPEHEAEARARADALRAVVSALQPFAKEARERIVAAALEWLDT